MDFKERENINARLNSLDPLKEPVFGIMTPQHMVEHLSLVISISNGKRDVPLVSAPEKLPGLKRFLEGPQPFPEGVKAPFMEKDKLQRLYYPDLSAAKGRLLKEIDDFEAFYDQYPQAERVHPVFGPLGKHHWGLFHNKHFTHHFRQFEI